MKSAKHLVYGKLDQNGVCNFLPVEGLLAGLEVINS
jgi:hypothetical protein